jgi:hypothetical protein
MYQYSLETYILLYFSNIKLFYIIKNTFLILETFFIYCQKKKPFLIEILPSTLILLINEQVYIKVKEIYINDFVNNK